MFRKLIINLVLNTATLAIVLKILPEIQLNGGIPAIITCGIIFGLVNGIVKPILKLLTFPLKYLTMGLSILALNVLMMYLGDYLIEAAFPTSFDLVFTSGLVSYIKGGILFALINWTEHLIIK